MKELSNEQNEQNEELLFSSNLNPQYGFENFIVGENNNLAKSVAIKIAQNPPQRYNPFFIYGKSGLGKTHLIQAIGNHITAKTPQARVRYVRTEEFTNELINSLRRGGDINTRMTKFRQKYRNIDVLLLDDIQFAEDKARTNEELFHAYDPHSIKDAVDAIPKETKSIFGEFMNIIMNLHVPDKLATFFVLNVAQNIILSKDKSKEALKKVTADSFKQAFINTVVYDICDLAADQTITKNATDTIVDMKQNLESYPDVFKKFIETEHEFFEKLNLDTLDSQEFTRQFKNKTFVYNLSKWSDAQIQEFSELWRNRKRQNQATEQLVALGGIKTQTTTKERNSTLINPTNNIQIKKEIEEMQNILKTQQNLLSSKDNFGYNRIAGYEKNKIIIAQKFISPVGLEKSNQNIDIPGAVLLFGPTNTGKSTFSQSIAEQAKCRFVKFPTLIQDDKVIEKLYKIAEAAEEAFNSESSRKRTIILIDEFDGLGKNPKLLNDLKYFINECSKKYHCTLFLTTNNPTKIEPSLLSDIIKLPMGPSTKHDFQEVLSHYLKNKVDNTFNYDLVANELVKHYPDKIYSNAQIENLCDLSYQAKKGKSINQSEIINLIEKIEPEITKDDIAKFEIEKLKLKEYGNKYEQN